MRWRQAFVLGLLVVSVGGPRVAVGVPSEDQPSLVLTGYVDIGTGADGRLLVLIDTDPPDGLVDQAFGLQDAPALSYSGPARVAYTRNRLAVTTGESAGWVFTVAGWPISPPDARLAAFDIAGLARSSGASIHRLAETLFSALPARCSSTRTQAAAMLGGTGSSDCGNCETGGPGVSSCGIDCQNNSFSADCSLGKFACCNCVTGCICCTSINGSGHH